VKTVSPLFLTYGLLLLLSLTGCPQKTSPTQAFIPQDPLVQVYFNQSQGSSYKEPYRQLTRPGDNLEQVIIDTITSSQFTVDVAVQELRLPKISHALLQRHKAGVKVRVIVENTYRRPWSTFSAAELAKLPPRERDRYNEFIKLVDTNKDGKLSQEEIQQGDALVILENGGIPIIDDRADGSRGSDLMHHKFIVVDNKRVIVTSANFTTSDIHGDFASPESRGNSNNLLKIESPELARLFTQEFNQMWGSGITAKKDSKFGIKKTFRPVQSVNIGKSKVAIQFSPTSPKQPWEESVNGLIGLNLANAKKSVDLALFVFSEQRLANILEKPSLNGMPIRVLIDKNFAYRSYSEALDMMGVTYTEKCRIDGDNKPWKKPISTVGVPNLAKGDLLHHKFAVLDGKTVITGSHNWSVAANHNNDETLLVIENPIVAAHFEREFNRLYSNASLGLPARIQEKIAGRQDAYLHIKECPSPKVVSSSPTTKLDNLPLSPININTASQGELEKLPGVGKKSAQKIIQAREIKPFTSLEDVKQRVSGISQPVLDKWRDRVIFN
jgi:competence ComEA-like helix-hairpin-helix protein